MPTDNTGAAFSARLQALPMTAAEAERAAGLALTRPQELNRSVTVVHILAEQASRTPDAVAVVHAGLRMSYGQLLVEVARVHQLLADDGCRAGDVVACVGARSRMTLALFLALESLGCIYLPIDPEWPDARIFSVLKRSGADRVASYLAAHETQARESVDHVAASLGVRVHTIHEDRLGGGAQPADPRVSLRSHCADSSEPRYVFYTSGTTGVPKGALIEHQGMMNHLWGKVLDLDLTDRDAVAFSAPLTFDIAIWQMLTPLLVGGSLVVMDDDQMSFARLLVREIHLRGVTVLELVPSTLGLFTDEVLRAEGEFSKLRWILSTGEELHPSVAARAMRALPTTGLINAWGFTECSDDLTHHVVQDFETGGDRLPVGQPIANAALYILVQQDSGGWQAAEHGEVGEIFAGGVAVGRGYLADQAATATAFFQDVIDPSSPTHRLYKGGDAGFIKAGKLHFVGRLDRQVKVAGVRMELGEIESVLLRHPRVADCAVVALGDGEDRQLVACYTVKGHMIEEVELSALVRAALPAPMVPYRWLVLDHMPLNGNGKVDHEALRQRVEQHL